MTNPLNDQIPQRKIINGSDPKVDYESRRIPDCYRTIAQTMMAAGYGIGLRQCADGGYYFTTTDLTTEGRFWEVDLELLRLAHHPLAFMREEVEAATA